MKEIHLRDLNRKNFKIKEYFGRSNFYNLFQLTISQCSCLNSKDLYLAIVYCLETGWRRQWTKSSFYFSRKMTLNIRKTKYRMFFQSVLKVGMIQGRGRVGSKMFTSCFLDV